VPLEITLEKPKKPTRASAGSTNTIGTNVTATSKSTETEAKPLTSTSG